MASHVCPRCGKKGPALLREGQVCNSCRSNWAWTSFANNNQQITIAPETVTGAGTKPARQPAPAKASTGTWVLLVSSLVMSAVVIALLVYFFRHTPSGVSGVNILNRFNTLALIAGALALLAIGLSGSAVFLGVQKRYRQTAFHVASGVAVVLAVAVFVAAVVGWSKTERVRSLAAEFPQATSNDAMVQRLQNATVVVQAHDPSQSRYRSSKRNGIILAAESGRILVLTVPFSDADGNGPVQPHDLWVNFTDGRTLPGRFRLAATNSIAIVEVEGDKPPAQVQFHPLAEAIIPSQPVLVIPNPIYGWRYEQATILSRSGQRTSTGWSCAVKVDLGLEQMDLGSAIYDESGRLLGIMTALGEDGAESEFVILDSATVSAIEKIRQAQEKQR